MKSRDGSDSNVIANSVLFHRRDGGRKNATKKSTKQMIDHKDVDMLCQSVSARGRIIPRRVSGVSSKMQRQIAKAVKRARALALPLGEAAFFNQ